MSDFLSILWTIVSFILGIAWSLVWFILRDLLSTLLWLAIAIWVGFALRYRSFTLGSLAMLRYGRRGVGLLWRWLRSKPADAALLAASVPPPTKIVKEYHRHVPLGYVSVSAQLNVVLVALFILLATG